MKHETQNTASYLFPFSGNGKIPEEYGLAPVRALPAGHGNAAGTHVRTIRELEQDGSGIDMSRYNLIWLLAAAIILLIAIFFILAQLFTLLPELGQTNDAENVLSALPGITHNV